MVTKIIRFKLTFCFVFGRPRLLLVVMLSLTLSEMSLCFLQSLYENTGIEGNSEICHKSFFNTFFISLLINIINLMAHNFIYEY
jgi:hypothetical protein